MSRDTRNQDGTYDERDSDGRAGSPRGSRSNGGRGPSDPGMRRPGSNGGSGGNGMIRRPYGPSGAGSRGGSRGGDYPPSSGSRGYADDDDYSDEYDQPSRRSRADYRNGPPPGRDRGYDDEARSTSRDEILPLELFSIQSPRHREYIVFGHHCSEANA